MLRAWWILAFVASMYLCGILIQDLWNNWEESPVIVSFDHRLVSIGTIPLPAVTICPQSKIATNKINYTALYRNILKLDGENNRNLSNEEYSKSKQINKQQILQIDSFFRLTRLKGAAQICQDSFAGSLLEKFPENFTDESFTSTLREIATGLEDNILACSLINNTLSTCSKYFHDIITNEGVCFSFNLLGPSEVISNE